MFLQRFNVIQNIILSIEDFGKFSGGFGRLAQVLRVRPVATVRVGSDQVRAISAQHSPPLLLQQRHDQQEHRQVRGPGVGGAFVFEISVRDRLNS